MRLLRQLLAYNCWTGGGYNDLHCRGCNAESVLPQIRAAKQSHRLNPDAPYCAQAFVPTNPIKQGAALRIPAATVKLQRKTRKAYGYCCLSAGWLTALCQGYNEVPPGINRVRSLSMLVAKCLLVICCELRKCAASKDSPAGFFVLASCLRTANVDYRSAPATNADWVKTATIPLRRQSIARGRYRKAGISPLL